jgi:protoporphyrinogen/coproporphyrinogen III oxidase
MPRVAIVGGGISGLAAAYRLEKLRQSGTPVEYTLFESRSHLGGVIQTEHHDGYVIEAGADSFLSAKSWARDLCDEIGLGDQLIHSRDQERRTYIVVRNQLVPIPDGMQFMVPTSSRAVMTSRLFSVATKLRFLNEYLSPSKFKKNADDQSVERFVERHFGHEVVDRLAEPLLAGVYGGDASSMSVRAVLPMMVRMEEERGSLIRAALAARRTRSGAKSEPLFTTLRGGMGEMVRALVSKLPHSSIRTSSPVQRFAYQDGWRIMVNERNERFDALILAVPAYVAAALLRGTSATADSLANHLETIEYTSSIAVAFGYKADDVKRAGAKLPSGFGFLVPRSEGKRMLACTFVQQKFEHRVPEGRLLLRSFFGGKRNQDLIDLPDSDLATLAHHELRDILRWDLEPELTRVYRSSRAMAQYQVGHLDRITAIQSLASELPNFHLAGNAYQGIGIPDCIRSGEKAALAILKHISLLQESKITVPPR